MGTNLEARLRSAERTDVSTLRKLMPIDPSQGFVNWDSPPTYDDDVDEEEPIEGPLASDLEDEYEGDEFSPMFGGLYPEDDQLEEEEPTGDIDNYEEVDEDFSAKAEAPAIFIFGDSTADVGTNNFLPNTTALANFPYNGIDYPFSRPTGRFSNGFNTADQIARLFGYKRSPPPFLLLVSRQFSFKQNMLRGVNFASAGAGILDATGLIKWKEVVSMGKQVQQFEMVRGNISEIMGPTEIAGVLSKSLFFISVGSNDIFDYQDFNSTTLSKQDFMDTLEFSFHNHLKNLYDLGARKFGIVSVAPVGCLPSQRANNTSGQCKEELNELARMSHTRMGGLLQALSFQLKEMKHSLGNAYEMTINIIEDPLAFGFKDVKGACCGTGNFNGEGPCVKFFDPNLCSNCREYLFWDFFHPTAFASELAALTLYGGGPRFVKPMNFSQLAMVHV
ncbi:GDSL esterase/lipase At5g33370-like [Corylus avellana]|uniref:GDSL esterase/lipase At5g33370-like n=1 Tax=Corylus avellana TaxID=13451 RepID=UPI00286CD0F1|nr:GDSL esterase/lipase At5g33370-like [Corylus avellana]